MKNPNDQITINNPVAAAFEIAKAYIRLGCKLTDHKPLVDLPSGATMRIREDIFDEMTKMEPPPGYNFSFVEDRLWAINPVEQPILFCESDKQWKKIDFNGVENSI